MTIPYNIDADPDPTSQIAWPAARHRQRTPDMQLEQDSEPGSETAVSYQSTDGTGKRSTVASEHPRHRLTTWNLITLSISMAGAQIAWTVELGYGTPFLLSLGISEQVTSLVWLAGPISGLVAQPLIGAISDSSHSKYRRRYWVALSTVALVLSTTALAFCQSAAAFFVDLFGGGAGDWDPERQKQVSNVAIGIAVFAFYVLDFALNALQASLRNLLLDITPPEQLNAGNAWHSRMSQAGNIVGYGFGFLPLAKLPFLSFLGGDQFRKFCIVSMAMLVVTVWITCICHEEKETVDRRKDKHNKLYDVLENIYVAITTLPKPVRRVCFVQLFAFMGWFPFLFYSTTYVGQVMAYQLGQEPDIEIATRTGEFAMLIYSIVAVIAGVILPYLARRDPRLFPEEGDDEQRHTQRLRLVLHRWREESLSTGKALRLPRQALLLRDIWTGAMLLFTVLMLSSFWISTVSGAIAMISLVGICWSVACWVPFAIIMEFLKEMKECSSPVTTPYRAPGRCSLDERDPLVQHRYEDAEADGSTVGELLSETETKPVAGGTILGIHNLAIVMPQFIIALVASAIFRIVDDSVSTNPLPSPIPDDASVILASGGLGDHTTYFGKNGVAWVLRFGGLCTLFGAAFARMVPPTKGEKEMRAALRVLKALKEEEEEP
ncbi:MFS general substrate transporter [Gyrodon lividus]|nr:MFS general substrate transporter [Gyrodon lividus]